MLAVLFLVFNEGYLATGPDTDPVRQDLTAEAIRLTGLIRGLLPPGRGGSRAAGVDSPHRRAPPRPGLGQRRTGPARRAGPRGLGRGADRRGPPAGARAPGVRGAPGRSQILAAIGAVHTSARDIRDTDWSQVVALYDQLVSLDPSPVVALNRAIAVAELDGREVALAAVDRLEPRLAGYHAYHAARADLLRRLGRDEKSRAAYDRAIALAGNTAETAHLTRRRDQLG